MRVVILALIVALAFCAQPPVWPNQWESTFHEINTIFFLKGENDGTYYYDWTN